MVRKAYQTSGYAKEDSYLAVSRSFASRQYRIATNNLGGRWRCKIAAAPELDQTQSALGVTHEN